MVEIVRPYFTLFSRMCTTTPYLSSAKACTITMGPDTSPHVIRFTSFDHRRECRRLEYAFLTNAAATVRSVGAMSVRACVRPYGDGRMRGPTAARAVWGTLCIQQPVSTIRELYHKHLSRHRHRLKFVQPRRLEKGRSILRRLPLGVLAQRDLVFPTGPLLARGALGRELQRRWLRCWQRSGPRPRGPRAAAAAEPVAIDMVSLGRRELVGDRGGLRRLRHRLHHGGRHLSKVRVGVRVRVGKGAGSGSGSGSGAGSGAGSGSGSGSRSGSGSG